MNILESFGHAGQDTNQFMRREEKLSYPLPIHTRHIQIYFGIKESQIDVECYFDNITLTIHQRKTT